MGNDSDKEKWDRWAGSIAKAIENPDIVGDDELIAVFIDVIKRKIERKAKGTDSPNQKTLTIARVNG